MGKTDFKFINLLRVLLAIDGIGPGKIFSLLAKFNTLENILSADFKSLQKAAGVSSNLAERIISARNSISDAEKNTEIEFRKLEKINGRIVTYWDDDFPNLLRKIYYPPLLVYTLGDFSQMDKYCIAVVGTRNPTGYGKIQAEKFAEGLALQNITIVSGLARGIDSIAHKSCLKNNGRTIAVIGTGLDMVYPRENEKIYRQIAENGIVVSEFPLGTKPDAPNFPKRNRIISGLSLGTLIIETKLNGGAMQTAAHAIDQNREVFAVPGNLGVAQSEGTNMLIQKGEAKLVTSHEDIIIELENKLKPIIGSSAPKQTIELNLFEQKIIETIAEAPLHIDLIAAKTSMQTSDCLVHLLSLEFKGAVKQLPGKLFAAVN